MQQGTRGVDSEQEQPEERRGTAEAVVPRLAADLPARAAQDSAPHPPPLLHVQGEQRKLFLALAKICRLTLDLTGSLSRFTFQFSLHHSSQVCLHFTQGIFPNQFVLISSN